ncbi:MAG TPA: M48 family metallopeptidase [Gemmatimonadaceae bacterium]|nr:M48 family metallopeptidase [Gemmatimonadaceae bacterium]
MRLGSVLRGMFVGVVFMGSAVACTVDEEQEKALGADAAAQIDREAPFVSDAAVTTYITRFGNGLAQRSDEQAREWRFRVVDSDQVNAFALPGGFVYINRGLIERAGNASELAGVLGHEIAHVVLRHSAERLEKTQKTNIGVTIVCSLTSLCSSDAARVAINVGGAALFARFSRQDEFEADSAAVGITSRAGFDPEGIATMFAKLLGDRARQPAAVEGWFSSHPLEEARIDAVRRVIQSTAVANASNLATDESAFRTVQERLRSLPPPPSSPAGLPQ